jgi:hypothetical protein
MDDEHPDTCPDCGGELVDSILALLATQVPAVPGSRMRRGGTYTTEEGLKLGSGEWRQIRCVFCESESMTPIEMIPPLAHQASDGAYLGHCGSCDLDLKQGYRPGHNPNRRRRRRR